VHVDRHDLSANRPPDELPDLHDALGRFATHDPLKAKLVELRCFSGLTFGEAVALPEHLPIHRRSRFAVRMLLALRRAGRRSLRRKMSLA
jgi:hypothetical protein